MRLNCGCSPTDGAATFDDQDFAAGAAAKVTDQPAYIFRARVFSELIRVDVPMIFEPIGIWQGHI